MEALFYVLWFVGLVALFVWSRKRTAKRAQDKTDKRAELKSLAESRGWTHETGVPRFIDQFSGAGPLPDGKGVPGGNVVTGTHRGFAFHAFEHQTGGMPGGDIGGTRPDQTFYHSVWAMRLSEPVPDIRVVSRRWHSRVTSGSPVTTGIPQFDDDFHVVAEDEAGARMLLRGELGRFLLADPRFGDLPLEVRHGHLITWRSNEMLTTEILDPPLEFLADAAGRLPAQTA